MAKDDKEKNLNLFVKILLIVLFLMLGVIIWLIYKGITSNTITLSLLIIAILALVIPTFYIIIQLLTTITNKSRRKREARTRKQMR